MSETGGFAIVDVPLRDRAKLEGILQESFEGWYLRHSLGTLQDVEVVRAAVASAQNVGLVMLKTIEREVGYVYYIAVARAYRRRGVARSLLDDSLKHFMAEGVKEAFASTETDNIPSERLFQSQGFTNTTFGEVSKRYGRLHAIAMYRKMLVVPGEVLMHSMLS